MRSGWLRWDPDGVEGPRPIRFDRPEVPLVGLDERWTGPRWTGGFGHGSGGHISYVLGHGQRSGEPRVLVETAGLRLTAEDLDVPTLARRRTEQEAWTAWRAVTDGAPDDSWQLATIPLDGRPLRCGLGTTAELWLAVACTDELVLVTVTSWGVALDEIALTSLADLAAYEDGHGGPWN